MSRDDDDDFEWSKPKPKRVDETARYIQNGNLTKEGRDQVAAFSVRQLIPDAHCLLDMSAVHAAFKTWKDETSSYRGFSLDTLEKEDDFDRAITFRFNPTAPTLQTWELGPELSKADCDRVRESHSTWDFGVRARLRDHLGVETYDPNEDESSKVEYLVDGLLPLQGVHMFVARPETLKSWLAFSIAIAVSKGLPALGRFPVRQARTLVLDWEVGTREIRRRFRLLGADGSIFYKSFPTFRLSDEAFWIELEKLRPEFVVVDSLSAGNGTEYGELDTRFAEPLSRAARFAEMHRCTWLFLHHSPKAASLSDTESLFRGTGAIRSKVDSAFYFRLLPVGPNGEARAEVTSIKSRKGTGADRFSIQLTDERGVELFDGDEKAAPAVPLTDEDRVFAILAAEPGASGNHISDELEMRRETVTSALEALERAGRIRRDGKGRATGYRVAESFPESFPVERSGNDSGNDNSGAKTNAP